MPLGWEIINAKKTTPNKNIVFIKPRPGPDESFSQEYLERIAAQCVPIMNKHHLSIVSLEEYEPNREFWGRNFNNGEVIQLVLKSPSTAQWLPFKFVQMVFIHELAHCKEMNHSKSFWVIRNKLAAEMKALWDKGYIGEGLWGRGLLLSNGSFSCANLDFNEALPNFICGGTYQTKVTKKRKTRPTVTWKERKEIRLKKKFGTSGIILGADDEIKNQLEKKRKSSSKPKVAQSIRGRELRAAAALSRFETKNEVSSVNTTEINVNSEPETDIDSEIDPSLAPEVNECTSEQKLPDRMDQKMIRVCKSETQDSDLKMEMAEIIKLSNCCSLKTSGYGIFHEHSCNTAMTTPNQNLSNHTVDKGKYLVMKEELNYEIYKKQKQKQKFLDETDVCERSIDSLTCPACSFVNCTSSLTCSVCSNILRANLDHGSWRCEELSCKNNLYVNSSDVMFCGICATRRKLP